MDFAGHHHWHAEKGQSGQGKNRTGRNGEDSVIDVPAGTLVYDQQSAILLKDLVQPGQTVCVARGGRGGRGNAAFVTATCQAPRQWERGEPGGERDLRLELKLLADVGIVGLPNSGKSTLLSRISAARPKIAAYPFTTLVPQLGMVELSGYRRFVVAEVPGLIEGAHEGTGLGDAFLRHIERTGVVIHLIDIMPTESGPIDHYHTIRSELKSFSADLACKPELVVANKMDLTGSEATLKNLRAGIGCEVLGISAVTGQGIQPMLERVWGVLLDARRTSLGRAQAVSS